MKHLVFFDTEVTAGGKITDLGAVESNGNVLHSQKVDEFIDFIKESEYLCGHNIIEHDLKYLLKYFSPSQLRRLKFIDTLFWSPLLFPAKPYHRLVKDDKIISEEPNNPVNDSKKAKELFHDEIGAFNRLNEELKRIFYLLLKERREFGGFFDYLSFSCSGEKSLPDLIRAEFQNEFCSNAPLEKLISDNPVELAYCLALINVSDRYSVTPPWVLKNFPDVERVMYLLRNRPCTAGCHYCNRALDAKTGLKDFFGFDSFRTFDGEPLQEKAVKAAVENKSLLAVFPTGGGKSLTFQLPALMAGRNVKGLTVVISPLQSLMKDQVDNLERMGITEAVTINGLLDPIERSKSFERVENGSASLLYISPESLRSKNIEHLLLGRNVVRFVIDEAHCLSTWGQDFRVDYLYIADFIASLQNKKNLSAPVPVSCFTATAKQKVIDDISLYFKEKLSLHLNVFKAGSSRANLTYKVFYCKDEEEKYGKTRLLIESKDCPVIIYVSRTRRAYQLAERLTRDGFDARPYHGKMEIKEKTKNQNMFISGDVKIMVATSAFGMGVDKKDVGMVIHYDISDSLENYVQEAGRAGRDEKITADCFVLYNEEDLNKHFVLLNQTKLTVSEIQQIWRAIKQITKFRSSVSNSALEIARKAGWDDNVTEIENRVKTAIAALEHAGYLKRGQNMPRIFANSILSKNAQQAIEKIYRSPRFTEQQKVRAIRIVKKLFSAKSKKHSNDEVAEARIDYISDHLGIVKEEVIKIITLLREEKILADTRDLTAFIKKSDNVNRSMSLLDSFLKIENFLLPQLEEYEKSFHIKELNEQALKNNCEGVNPNKIKTILNFWAVKNWIKRKNRDYSNNHIALICTLPKKVLTEKMKKRHLLSKFILSYLFEKSEMEKGDDGEDQNETLVEFSVHELKDKYSEHPEMFKADATVEDVEDALFFLSRIEAITIDGGFLVIYNKLTIDRLETNNLVQYKKDDYRQLEMFYQNRIQQIHIVGEYAKKMLVDYKEALTFVEDYFSLNYTSFLNKYFPGSRKDELKRNITPRKFKQLFGELSPRQLKIINDNKHRFILVAAGPGSGKTRVLVHKLASLLLMEDVKHEQLLMLTFSRAAATEFKKRLLRLIGNAANFVEIKTFHSYCFDLLGKIGNIEEATQIIAKAVEKIKSGDVEPNKIAKAVLVIDEAQDMDSDEYDLINVLTEKNELMRVVAVGDDDQNIFSFRGADSKYFSRFTEEKNSVKYELLENYRSCRNIVEFSNRFVSNIRNRLKTNQIVPVSKQNGLIHIVRYTHSGFIVPFVNHILSADLSGTTGVLTVTNEQALQITGLLLRNNFPSRLIQSNEGFNIYNLYEIRSFIGYLKRDITVPVISDDIWKSAKRKFAKEHRGSSNYDLCKNLIADFQETNPKTKYFSDFEDFIRESKLEDFTRNEGETVVVSTIHKAKGKEFDNVFLMLDSFDISTDDNKRQLYVALTRVKKNLFIHYNGNYFEGINVDGLKRSENKFPIPLPLQLVYHLTHRDVYLGYFAFVQKRLDALTSGSELGINKTGLVNSHNEQVLKFSKNFIKQRDDLESRGYRLSRAKIRFILFWEYTGEEGNEPKEIKIILPELLFEKNDL